MSTMAANGSRRARRQFSEEFRAQAVRLVLDEGKTVGAVARELDLTASALRQWVERARADRTGGKTGLTTAEREELARLRKENRELRTEREISKSESRACGPDLSRARDTTEPSTSSPCGRRLSSLRIPRIVISQSTPS